MIKNTLMALGWVLPKLGIDKFLATQCFEDIFLLKLGKVSTQIDSGNTPFKK